MKRLYRRAVVSVIEMAVVAAMLLLPMALIGALCHLVGAI